MRPMDMMTDMPKTKERYLGPAFGIVRIAVAGSVLTPYARRHLCRVVEKSKIPSEGIMAVTE
jgi:hypothetical protein